jgi:acyl-CoA thioester hydrolase
MKNPTISDFPVKTFDKIRYSDTDRQGHVNNSIFSSFLETGRVEILYNSEKPLLKLFQNNICVADAETIIVQVNDQTKKSHPLSEKTKSLLMELQITEE